jgi:hypothetical protein
MAQSKGKGWFGDPKGHAAAGRKGGLARSKKAKGNQRGNNDNS